MQSDLVLYRSGEDRPAHRGAGDRCGLQQSVEQRLSAPVEFLIEFTRALIKQNPSSDLFYLAMYAAEAKVSLTTEQKALFIKAVSAEARQSAWPEGFFG
jgi:hypothetical protein